MSETQLRKLRAQVTIAMDATLRKAALEIMSIFENTLRDHKRELAEKEEMVAQLKLKLQVAELRLKDLEVEGPGAAVANEIQAIPEIVPDVPVEVPVETEIVLAPEIVPAPETDFEVPDDWCAPVSTEHLAKQEEEVCPSVRLRQFSIPLRQVHVAKEESVDNFGSPQTTSDDMTKSMTLAGPSEIPKPAQRGGLRGKGSRMQNEISLLFKQLSPETYIDISGSELRKSRRLEEEERKKKPFQCAKCKKRFRRAKTLKKHQERKHKTKDAKEDLGWTQPLEDVDDNLNDVISKNEDSEQNTGSKKVVEKHRKVDIAYQSCGEQVENGYICSVCQKVAKSRYHLKEHYRIHTGEKPYSCSLCSRNFRFKSQYTTHLKSHRESESQLSTGE